MFTGIITDLGEVRSIEEHGDLRFTIATGYAVETIAIGASIACSGACLTVVDKDADWFAVDVSGETVRRTTLGDWREGRAVNLERPLALGDELGGHLVLGHVDGVARVIGREAVGNSLRLGFTAPDGLAHLVAEKGSIALDGVSLTVNRVAGAEFDVNLIPHTLRSTSLGRLRRGDRANLEVDVLARYVARLADRGVP
ncbi:MAG: riboflavin synthase [Alphaproteobacteria bacterium]